MNTEIYIEGYRLDITEDISSLMNFAIDDIKDFSARSTAWSKTIVLPGTANNNRLFGNIFQVGQSNNYNSALPNVSYNFNAAKSASCIIFQDQMQTFKGVLRLLQINISNGFQGKCEYEVSVFGNLAGLNVALSGALIESLDFSAYNHTYTVTNIVNSWDNPGGSGVYYPLMDYGTYSTNKHDWDIRTFRPALYVREYIDKMITAAGFRWQSNLFDTPRFKSLIVPFNRKALTILSTDLYKGFNTTNKSGSFPVGSFALVFDNHTGTGFTANGTNDVFTYNGTTTNNLIVHFKFEGTFGGTGFFPSISLDVWKNGTSGTNIFSTFTIFTPFTIESTITSSFAPGDTIEFRFSGESGAAYNITSSAFDITTATAIPINVTIGDTIVMNDQTPKNIRQIDFLVSIVKLFNLYIYEDKFDETLLYITPYIDFYSHNTSNAVEWTGKLNRNKITKVKPMSELNAKIYKFKYKSDSDYYNELYRKRYNDGYGDRIYDSEFEFTEQEKSFEIVFSATPLVGYGGEDKVYSTIFKQTGNAPTVTEENVDSNIRILQSKKITGISSWDMKDGVTVLNTLTRYGYAGHLDDPTLPTNDLNFGATRELFFILTAGNLSNNQFNVYWSGYMREITDKDSKLVTANFYLTARDILNLDFSKYIYVDGVAFRLNAIKDYNASKPSDCVVELLKVNLASYSESSAGSGPPDGCYLLWNDGETLDWNDGEPLLYGDCTDNPGDGVEPEPGTVFYLNWTFVKTTLFGTFRIYINGELTVITSAASDSGSFVINAGDIIKADVIGQATKPKTLLMTNDVDGIVFNGSSSSLPTLTHTITIDASKNYNVQGTINN